MRLYGFRNPKHTDERGIQIQAQPLTKAEPIRFRNPRPVRDHSHRTFEPGLTYITLNVMTMNDNAARGVQNSPEHRQTVVVRADFQRANTPGVRQRVSSAFELHLTHICVPIVALDRTVGDQVMEVRFMHDDHTRRLNRLIVDKAVITVVADLIERNIEQRGIECPLFLAEDLNLSDFRKRFEQERPNSPRCRSWTAAWVRRTQSSADQLHAKFPHCERYAEHQGRTCGILREKKLGCRFRRGSLDCRKQFVRFRRLSCDRNLLSAGEGNSHGVPATVVHLLLAGNRPAASSRRMN